MADDPRESAHDDAAAGEPAPDARVQDLERQLVEQKDRMLRAMAEADNVRRRAQRDAEDRVRYANEALLRELVPVLDNLDRALASARAAPGDGRGGRGARRGRGLGGAARLLPGARCLAGRQ